MPKVVLAVLVIFDVVPLEVAAAAAVDWEWVSLLYLLDWVGDDKWVCKDVPATFFSDTGHKIHDA